LFGAAVFTAAALYLKTVIWQSGQFRDFFKENALAFAIMGN
jgi:hypothetical protein